MTATRTLIFGFRFDADSVLAWPIQRLMFFYKQSQLYLASKPAAGG